MHRKKEPFTRTGPGEMYRWLLSFRSVYPTSATYLLSPKDLPQLMFMTSVSTSFVPLPTLMMLAQFASTIYMHAWFLHPL